MTKLYHTQYKTCKNKQINLQQNITKFMHDKFITVGKNVFKAIPLYCLFS